MSTRISSLSIILLAPCLALAPVQAAPTPEFSKLDQAVKAGIGRDRAGGASVAMVHGGKIVSEAHYGFADSASRRQPDSRTIYRIGSVSKAFTAVMLLQLVDRGTVRLTDRADRYVPELRLLTGRPLHSPPVTLIQLATHTAGLPGEPGGPEPGPPPPVRSRAIRRAGRSPSPASARTTCASTASRSRSASCAP